ncbi:ABC transporter permease, partial [Aetokthonos hydrillicola]|nr:ABC transporter permease [Aetokthonos hydrillicola CCALA 1050]
IYPASSIPPQWRNLVFWLNPLTAVVEVYRDLLLVGEVHHWGEWGVSTIVSSIVFCGGLWCYRRLRPAFADVL